MVYVDDVSDDGTPDKIEELLFLEYPEMKDKLTIVRNSQRVYSLANRHKAITQYCHEDDIIVDIDADDELIGSQVLKFFNALYHQNPQAWLVYSNTVTILESMRDIFKGASEPIKAESFATHTFRLEPFTISHLRSFRRKVYMKINEDDFKDKEGNFHHWVADLFIYTALAELSGPDRIVFVDECNIKTK